MYSTCEPCPMCMANALWARLDRVVYGATIADASRHCPADSHSGARKWRGARTCPASSRPGAARTLQHAFHAPEYAEGFSHNGATRKDATTQERIEAVGHRSARSMRPDATPPRLASLLGDRRARAHASARSSSSFRAISTGIRRCCASSSTAKWATSSCSRSTPRKFKASCATATRTIFPSPRAARAPAITARRFRCTAAWCSISRAWTGSKRFSLTASPFASPACVWACSKTKRAKSAGSCAAIPRRSSRHRWADFSAADRAASARWRTAICAISDGARDRSGHHGAGAARRAPRRRSGPRNSARLGHQRHHHAHLAGAGARGRMVAVRRRVRHFRRRFRFQRAHRQRSGMDQAPGDARSSGRFRLFSRR